MRALQPLDEANNTNVSEWCTELHTLRYPNRLSSTCGRIRLDWMTLTDTERLEIVTRVLHKYRVDGNSETYLSRTLRFWEDVYREIGAALRHAGASEVEIKAYLHGHAYRLCCDPVMANDHIEKLIDAASVGLGVSLGGHLHVAAARAWIARGQL